MLHIRHPSSIIETRARSLNPSPLAGADATIATFAVYARTDAVAIRVAQVRPGIFPETAAVRVGSPSAFHSVDTIAKLVWVHPAECDRGLAAYVNASHGVVAVCLAALTVIRNEVKRSFVHARGVYRKVHRWSAARWGAAGGSTASGRYSFSGEGLTRADTTHVAAVVASALAFGVRGA